MWEYGDKRSIFISSDDTTCSWVTTLLASHAVRCSGIKGVHAPHSLLTDVCRAGSLSAFWRSQTLIVLSLVYCSSCAPKEDLLYSLNAWVSPGNPYFMPS